MAFASIDINLSKVKPKSVILRQNNVKLASIEFHLTSHWRTIFE